MKSQTFQGFPTRHPYVVNADGSKSNVKLGTFGIGDKQYVIPTMVEGKLLDANQSVEIARKYGFDKYPSFDTIEEADSWAKQYHGNVDEEGKIIQNTERIFGFPKREPYESELNFFKQRPEVAGMATEDNAIILNPFSKLSDQEKQSVAKNEAIRLWLKKNNVQPQFNLTPEQFKFFRNTEYGQSKDATPLRQTIIARILTGDPSVGKVTPMQKQWANWVMSRISKESQQQAE